MADVKYAQAEDGTNIAYQVLAASTDNGGSGTHDLVMVSGGMFPMEVFDQGAGSPASWKVCSPWVES